MNLSKSRKPLPGETTPEYLARLFPPLARYWPHLSNVTKQQATYLMLDHEEALYGGAVGGGKSDALLAAALQYVDTPGYAALILRRTFSQLALPGAIMDRSKEWLMLHRGDGVRWNEDQKKWTFPSGATLTFGYLESPNDVYRYQGAELSFVGFDELQQFEQTSYEYLFSRVRRNKDLEALGIPMRFRASANPGGIGHAFVKARFIDDKTRSRNIVFIPARVWDNPGIDVDDYVKRLDHLSPDLRQQLLEGDWDAVLGAAFYITDDHLVDEFELEASINRYEALDYGLNGAPWGLWATDYDGNIVAVDMRYWEQELPSDIVPEVLALRTHWWGVDNTCYADPALWKKTYGRTRWGEPAMLDAEFSDNGITLVRANNSPRAGYARLLELLKLDPDHEFPGWHPRAGEKGAPRLFLVRGACDLLIEKLREAPLQPKHMRDGGEIIDQGWESRHGHAVAMARYAVMEKPEASNLPLPADLPPRERFVREQLLKRDKERDRMLRSRRPRAYVL